MTAVFATILLHAGALARAVPLFKRAQTFAPTPLDLGG